MNVEISDALLDALVKVGKVSTCDRVLVVGVEEQKKLKSLKKKLIYAHSEPYVAGGLESLGYNVVVLPGLTDTRMDRLKAAIVGAVSANLMDTGENVVAALSSRDGQHIDTVMHITASDEADAHHSLVVTDLGGNVPPQLLEVVVNLALRIGREGYEGRALGALIVVGESTAVMEHSHPLTLNPFQGYSEAERNLFDPHVRDAVRTFAMLDGAVVVRDDGVVLAAGRHLHMSDVVPDVPLGLGSRHTAAATISADTDAIAVSVSQSSGEVRVFKGGEIVLEITPSGRRAGGIADVVRVPPKKRGRLREVQLTVEGGRAPKVPQRRAEDRRATDKKVGGEKKTTERRAEKKEKSSDKKSGDKPVQKSTQKKAKAGSRRGTKKAR